MGLPALSQRGCSVWGGGELLIPGMGRGIVEALSARQCSPGETGVTGALSAQISVWERGSADAPFSELTLWTALAPANSSWLWPPRPPFSGGGPHLALWLAPEPLSVSLLRSATRSLRPSTPT